MFSSNDTSSLKKSLLELEARLQEQQQESRQRLGLLEKKVNRLVELLEEKLALSKEELETVPDESIEELTDDSLESLAEPEACPRCGRPVSLKTGHCLYCGADEETVAEALKKFEPK